MLRNKYKAEYQELVKTSWKAKAMHGRLPEYLENPTIDMEQSFQWMKHTGLKGETEGLIIGAQDQALKTRYYAKHIMKQCDTDKCRMCSSQKQSSTSWLGVQN